MNNNESDVTFETMIGTMSKRIYELASNGYTKEQIIQYLQNIGRLAGAEKLIDLGLTGAIDKAIDFAIMSTHSPEIKTETQKLYQQLVDDKNLSYIGQDGRDYSSASELERANSEYQEYMNPKIGKAR